VGDNIHGEREMIAKASVSANLEHKWFISKDVATLLIAFVTYDRPILEYVRLLCLVMHGTYTFSIQQFAA
jgi:hypothetical protein